MFRNKEVEMTTGPAAVARLGDPVAHPSVMANVERVLGGRRRRRRLEREREMKHKTVRVCSAAPRPRPKKRLLRISDRGSTNF